ncbi:MAG: hypothetical protein MHM6MM_006410 [Cercozoa sp. M6MM]
MVQLEDMEGFAQLAAETDMELRLKDGECLQRQSVTAVAFNSEVCGRDCTSLARLLPRLATLANQNEQELGVASVNCDSFEQLCQRHRVPIPSLLLFVDTKSERPRVVSLRLPEIAQTPVVVLEWARLASRPLFEQSPEEGDGVIVGNAAQYRAEGVARELRQLDPALSVSWNKALEGVLVQVEGTMTMLPAETLQKPAREAALDILQAAKPSLGRITPLNELSYKHQTKPLLTFVIDGEEDFERAQEISAKWSHKFVSVFAYRQDGAHLMHLRFLRVKPKDKIFVSVGNKRWRIKDSAKLAEWAPSQQHTTDSSEPSGPEDADNDNNQGEEESKLPFVEYGISAAQWTSWHEAHSNKDRLVLLCDRHGLVYGEFKGECHSALFEWRKLNKQFDSNRNVRVAFVDTGLDEIVDISHTSRPRALLFPAKSNAAPLELRMPTGIFADYVTEALCQLGNAVDVYEVCEPSHSEL